MKVERFKRVHDPAFEHYTFGDRIHITVSESAKADGSVVWRCWVIAEDGDAIDDDYGTSPDKVSGLLEAQRQALLMACRNGVYG